MSRDIDQQSLGELYALDSENAEIVLLRVNYDGEMLYLARNNIDITFGAKLYTALQFDVTLPDQKETGTGGSELKIADVFGDIYRLVRLSDEITAELEIISQTFAGIQNSIAIFPNMRLSNANWDENSATFNLFREDEGIYTFPSDVMDNMLFPGLY